MDHSPAQVSREALESLELLNSVDMDAVEPLLRDCQIRHLESGDVLLRAGEENQLLYLVLEGNLSVHLGSPTEKPIASIGAGESVGELSVLDRRPTSAFVLAQTKASLLVVDEELLWMLANTSHAISTNLLFTLAKRLRYGNAVIGQDREQLKEYRFHATVDGLTGLFNRYWLNKMLPRQIDRCTKQREPFSMVMIDIDHFKSFNDTHGHVAGDHALCAVSATMLEHLRPSDMAARYGGEEFLVLLPNSRLADAQFVAERLRAAVERTQIISPGGAALPSVTISIGVAELTGPVALHEFLGATDAALYRAKHGGRNRVSV